MGISASLRAYEGDIFVSAQNNLISHVAENSVLNHTGPPGNSLCHIRGVGNRRAKMTVDDQMPFIGPKRHTVWYPPLRSCNVHVG